MSLQGWFPLRLTGLISLGCAVLNCSVCPTLCDPHGLQPAKLLCLWGILQARILEWVAMPFSRGSSQPRSPELQVDSLPSELPGKPKNTWVGSLSILWGGLPDPGRDLGSLALQVDSSPAKLPGRPFDLFRRRLASLSFTSDLSVLNALQWKDFNSIGSKEQERREVERKSCVCVCVCVLGCTWGEWVGIGNAGEGSRDFPKRLPQERNLIWEWFFYQRRAIGGHASLPKEVSGGFDIYSLTHFSVIYWQLGMCQELCQIWGFSKENVLVPHYREWITKREEKNMFF